MFSYNNFFKKSKKTIVDLIILFLILCVGLIGNLISGYSRSILLIVEDAFLVLKFPIIILGLFIILRKMRFNAFNVFIILYGISIILLPIMFFNCLYKISIQGFVRVGFLNTHYTGTTGFYGFLFGLIVYIFSTYKYGKITIFNWIFLIFGFLLTILSISTTAICFYVLFGSFVFAKKNKYLKIAIFFGGLLSLYFISISKFAGYFMDQNAPRYLLFEGSFILLKKYFPVGCGFSLFGSSIAGSFYSPIYFDFGWNDIWVMREGSNFLGDAFFPVLFGELGLLGSILYIILVFRLLLLLNNNDLHSLSFSSFLFLLLFLSGMVFNFLNSSTGLFFVLLVILFNSFENNFYLYSDKNN